MPRRPRQISSTGMYHVVIKGVNHEAIFEKEWQKQSILKLLGKKSEEHKVDVYSYCVMSTHMHILLQGEMKNISKFEREIGSIYAVVYNRYMGRNGHLFQDRFYSGVIETENAFWNCVNYIHNNPVKANMVDRPEKYKYSSYNDFSQENPLHVTGKSIKMMKARFVNQAEFKAFSHKNMQESWFYGTEEEMKQQKKELILQALQEYVDPTKLFTAKKDILKSEFIDKIAEELKVTKIEVANCMIDEFLN